MIYSLEQRQQQKQKLTQEQQFFMEMLKMNKEELAGLFGRGISEQSIARL